MGKDQKRPPHYPPFPAHSGGFITLGYVAGTVAMLVALPYEQHQRPGRLYDCDRFFVPPARGG